jgi:hypothetical protein
MGHKKAQKAQKAQNEFKGVEGSTDKPSFLCLFVANCFYSLAA